MEKSIDSAQIHERAVVGDVLDDAIEDFAFLQTDEEVAARFLTAFFENGAAGDDDIASAAVHLEDVERLRRAHQRRYVAHGTDIHL